MTKAQNELSPRGRAWLAKSMEWLLDEARLEEAPQAYLLRLMAHLNGFGLDLSGGSIVLEPMHPQLEMMVQRWRPRGADEVDVGDLRTLHGRGRVADDDGVVELYYMRHGHTDEAIYRKSPFYHAAQTGGVSRWKLSEHETNPRFPIFTDLLARGETEYLVADLPMPKPYRAGLSLSTKHPEGFPADITAYLAGLLQPLRLSLAHKVERITLEEILGTYLSSSPAREIANGNVRLGRTRSVDAIVGFADLRGFTDLSQRVSGEVLVTTMNRFFSGLEQAVRQAGGEVLKFMGDGALFVFTCDSADECELAHGAVQALSELPATLAKRHDEDNAIPLRFACALHRGKVRYGNVGAPGRLDFTIIGADVNKTARLEEVAARHDLDLVISAELARILRRPTRSLGHYRIKGSREEQEVFVLA